MLEYIRNELLGMTDKGEYSAFTSSLIPGCDNIIGIRQPVLKQYAKQLIKENRNVRLKTEQDLESVVIFFEVAAFFFCVSLAKSLFLRSR